MSTVHSKLFKFQDQTSFKRVSVYTNDYEFEAILSEPNAGENTTLSMRRLPEFELREADGMHI